MAIEIQTTQNVTLHLREAGLGPRILARLLDMLFIFLWFMGCLVVMMDIIDQDTMSTLLIIMVLIPYAFYDLLFEWLNEGQSPGKKIMKIRVVNLDGTTPSLGGYLIRWLFRMVDFQLTMSALAVIMVAFTEKSQRLGDYLAGTTVISLKPEKESEQLSIPDIDIYENYEPMYSDLLDKLTDSDMNTVRSILNDRRYFDDQSTLNYLANKIKNITGYTFDGSDRNFLQRLLDDYNYLSMQ